MKKFFAILLIAALVLQGYPVVAKATTGTPEICVSQGTAAPGETVAVEIALADNPGIVTMQLQVVFDDTVLTLKEVQDKGLLGSATHKPEKVNPYILRWANNTVTENFTSNGTIAVLIFEIAEDAQEGAYPVTVSYDYNNYDIIDWQMNKVNFSVTNGVVNVGQAAPTALDQFAYSLFGAEMTITGYVGEETKVVIGNTYDVEGTEYTVTAIDDSAFEENAVIESIIIPGTVQTIGDYAFYYCENLISAELGDGLQTIGEGAFSGSGLTKVVLPKSVTYVGVDAFYDCIDLMHTVVLGKDTEIDEYALGYDWETKRNPYVLREGFVLEGHSNSTADAYAGAEGIEFKVLLRIASASLSLQHNLAINYKVNKVLFEKYGFSDPYVTIQMNDKQVKLTNYVVDGDKYVFTFRNVAPNQMNDTICATLYATYNGAEDASTMREYSVAEYCYSILTEYSGDEHTKLRTLLVDLLHYGAASQTYTGYKTDALVNASLTTAQLQWGTNEEPALNTVLDTTYKTVENSFATWKGAGLNLQDAVAMRLKFTAENIDGLTVKIESGESTWTISSNKFMEEDGVYYVYFTGLDAGQMRQSVYLTICEGDTPVSNTVCYSIGSYAYEKQNSTIDGLPELVKAMMKYGDSAYAYVH